MEPIEAELVGASSTKATSDETTDHTGQTNGSFIEQILSPLMLQRMMASGGGILVLGFVGWLWSIGIFESPVVVAVTIGVLNFAVLAGGIALVRISRYRLAGNGLTHLAALAMPLNIWFYSAQGLITIEGGGHLWIPAAICCGIYAAVARLLRDPMFVYTLVGGYVLTGLLFLADESVGRFWALLPPATFLVGTAWSCICAQRFFPDEGDFSKERFGAAFRNCGFVVLTGGLGIVLCGQLTCLFGEAFGLSKLPLLASEQMQRLWAFALIAGSAIGLVGDYLTAKTRVKFVSSLAMVGWSILALMNVLSLQPTLPHLTIVVCLVIIGNVVHETRLLARILKREESLGGSASQHSIEIGGWAPCALALGVLGFIQFCGQFYVSDSNLVIAPVGWLSAISLVMTSAVCFAVWSATRLKQENEGVAAGGLCDMAAMGGLVAAWGAMSIGFALGIATLDIIVALGLLLPVGCMLLGRWSQQAAVRDGCYASAVAGVSMLLICSASVAIAGLASPYSIHVTLAWISAIAAAVYLLAARTTASPSQIVGYGAATVCTSQLLILAGLNSDYAMVLAASVMGLGLAIVNALRRNSVTEPEFTDGNKLEVPANTLVVAGSVMTMLLSLSRVIEHRAVPGLFVLLVGQLAIVGVTGWLAMIDGWRRTFRATSLGIAATGILVFNSFLDAHWLHRVELASMSLGIVLLAMGHVGWYREGEHEDEMASVGLWLGSLLVTVPVGLGLVFYRTFEVDTQTTWMLFHEITALVVSLGLLGAGFACRIRSTTIMGVTLLTTYVVSILSLMQWPSQLQSVSVVMMVAGGCFFLIAVVLSIYRDRLVALPADIRAGKGVFRVLQWR